MSRKTHCDRCDKIMIRENTPIRKNRGWIVKKNFMPSMGKSGELEIDICTSCDKELQLLITNWMKSG